MKTLLRCLLTVVALFAGLNYSSAQITSVITYQGALKLGGSPATGLYDFSFAVFNAATGGAQQGSTIVTNGVAVTNGYFAAAINFGDVYAGGPLWLDISVRTNGAASYSALTPRQPLTATPYALYTPSAGVASVASGVAPGSVTAAGLAPGAVSQLGTPNGSLSNVVQVSNNGWVGIGTNAPNAALEVTGGASILVPVVYAEVADGTGSFTNLRGASAVAFSTNLLAVSAFDDEAVTLVDTSSDTLAWRSSITNGQGAFTNLSGAWGIAFSSNGLLAVAGNRSNAVTLISATNPASPAWLSTVRDGVGPFSLLSGARAVAFSGNFLAVAAEYDNAVTLVNVSNPGSPALAGFMQDGFNNFTNLSRPIGLAFSGNLLAIASYGSSAVTLVDVSNPSSPQLRAVLNGSTGFGLLAGAEAMAFSGNLLAIAAGSANTVTLVNVSNPANPTLYAAIQQYAAGVTDLWTPRGLALMQRNGRTLLVVTAASSSAVSIFDVTTPSTPVLRGVIRSGQSGAHYLTTPLAVAPNSRNAFAVAGYGSSGATLFGLADKQAGFASDTWVGIGTTLPKAPLNVNGDVLVENANRFTVQAARVELGSANNASGINSSAIGYHTTASGYYSMAMGIGTTASGNDSTAMGGNTTASGVFSTAMGSETTASGYSSTAMGDHTTAGGQSSTAIGFSTTASGNNSFAMGDTSIAASFECFAGGYHAIATNAGCFVWSDYQPGTAFGSTANNQFLIRARGGVGINTNNPNGAALSVNGTVTATNFVGSGSGLTGVAQLGLNQTFTGSPSFAGTVYFENNAYLHNHDLFVAVDNFHGLGWYGTGKLFAGVNVNGPVLYGYDGGALGSRGSSDKIALRWDGNQNLTAYGNVGVYKSNPATALDVNGTVSATNFVGSGAGLTGVAQLGLNQTFTGSPTFAGAVYFDNNAYLRSHDLYVAQDALHGLGWYGTGKLFAGVNVNGPVLYGNNGGALGSRGASDNVALRWDGSQNLNAYGNLGMNLHEIYLNTDSNHGLGYYGVGRLYGGLNIDGPVLYGWSGGALGTIGTGTNWTLRWYSTGNAAFRGSLTATAFNPSSDRNLKENFAPVDPTDVLDKVTRLPVSQWNFKQDSSARHLGPMAQDFHAAFGLGSDDRHIATVDSDGVALAAIQGLNAKVEAENRALKQELAELKRVVAELSSRLGANGPAN